MELGQILHNNPVAFRAEDFHAALLTAIRSKIARVHWNVYKKPWREAGSADIGGHVDRWTDEWRQLSEDPQIPGIEWHSYYNWGGSPDDPDWDQAKADAPNFSFEGVQFRWYKHFGRSLNVNVVWPAEKWLRWFERCIQTLEAFESHHLSFLYLGKRVEYPDASDRVSLSPEAEDLRYVQLMERIHVLERRLNEIACICIDASEGQAPKLAKNDIVSCQELDWVARLARHALKAKGRLKLDDDD